MTTPGEGDASEIVDLPDLLPPVGEVFWAGGGRPRCCDQDDGGSHYHCGGGCGAVTSMYGHFVRVRGDEPDWMAKHRNLPIGFEDHWCKAVLALTSFMHGLVVHFGSTERGTDGR